MKALAIILSLAVTLHSYAQEYSYKQFTTADGLPSNVVYSAYQDSKGFIWFCTNAGVSRFNGISFQNFTVETGLSDNEVFGAFEVDKSEGRVWFRTFSNKLCYYQNDTFYNSKNQPWLSKTFGAIKLAWVDTVTKTAWTRRYFNDSVYSMDENKKQIRNYPVVSNGKATFVTALGMGTITVQEEKLLYKKTNQFAKKYNGRTDLFPDVLSYFMFLRKYIQGLSKELPHVPVDYMYYVFLNLNPIQRFRLNEIIMQPDSSYWVAHGNKGILRGRNIHNADEKPVVYLPDHNVNNILVDNEGNYWFTSPTEGVFFLKGQGVRTYDIGGEAEIYSVNGNSKYVICGKEGKVTFINKLSGKKFDWQYDLVKNAAYNRVKDLFIDKAGNCWVATDYSLAGISFRNEKAQRLFPSPQQLNDDYVGAMKCFAPAISGDSIYVGSHAWLMSIDRNNNLHTLAFIRTHAVVDVPQKGVLVGTINGLYLYKHGKLTEYLSHSIKEHITDLEISNDGLIWAATNDLGLIILKDDSFHRITASGKPGGLASNICRKIFIDSAQNIWACTNKGLCLVKLESLSPFKYTVRQFTTDDGLISDDVNDVYVSGDTVWAATARGLSFFKIGDMKDKGVVPRIYISRMDTLSNHSFKFGSRIAIGLEGISYESLGKLRYRYRIPGLYDYWQNTSQNQLVYDLLPPGHYELEVYSINRFGQMSEHPQKVAFTIVPPWWRSVWAVMFYILTFIAVLAFAFAITRRNTRIKERNRVRLEQLELKALRSQMNPHFIFNMLNAVQKYILENDKEASYRYLTSFSKLIRGFLENSRQTTISLNDELDLLRAYIEMEALRFRNKFRYEIEVDPALDTAAIYIPSMLIQPYVENAIWHGIQHKETNGFVKLSVQGHGPNVLMCRIRDNGIGRKKAREIESASSTRHQPVGMTITKQRLELINQHLKQAVSVNFIDLEEGSVNGETGTIVELMITYSTRKI